MIRQRQRRYRSVNLHTDPERGAGGEALELIIVAAVIVVVLAVVLAIGRSAIGENKVSQAAAAAVRAASLQHDADTAQNAATDQASKTLTNAGLTCEAMHVAVDTAAFSAPAGQPATVSATVTCTVNLSQLFIPGWPGTRSLTATATSALDVTQERS